MPTYYQAKNIYKVMIQRKKWQNSVTLSNKLESLRSSDPVQYWHFWRKMRSTHDMPCWNGALDANVFADYYIKQNKTLQIEYLDQRSISDTDNFISLHQFVDDQNLDTVMNDILNAITIIKDNDSDDININNNNNDNDNDDNNNDNNDDDNGNGKSKCKSKSNKWVGR